MKAKKPKHTPGPWEIFGTAVILQKCNRTKFIANCSHAPNGKESEDERANAILIAAAPELLAALKAIVKAFRGAILDCADGKCAECKDIYNGTCEIKDAIAAIAKAEGGEK